MACVVIPAMSLLLSSGVMAQLAEPKVKTLAVAADPVKNAVDADGQSANLG
jgi:hypothetical protein